MNIISGAQLVTCCITFSLLRVYIVLSFTLANINVYSLYSAVLFFMFQHLQYSSDVAEGSVRELCDAESS